MIAWHETLVLIDHIMYPLCRQAKMWEYMGLIRIFTKRRGHPPDFTDPVILSSERSGTNVKAAAQHISREMIDVFNYALVRLRFTIRTSIDAQNCFFAVVFIVFFSVLSPSFFRLFVYLLTYRYSIHETYRSPGP